MATGISVGTGRPGRHDGWHAVWVSAPQSDEAVSITHPLIRIAITMQAGCHGLQAVLPRPRGLYIDRNPYEKDVLMFTNWWLSPHDLITTARKRHGLRALTACVRR